MKLLSVLLTSLSSISLVTALSSNPEGSPQDISDVICTGRPRTTCAVELDVPNGCEETDSNCPIVFFFHGSGGTNSRFKNKSGVHSAGYIGIYPNGERGWSTGPKSSDTCQWDDFQCTTDPDEGDYIASIIQEVKDQGANGNIYAIGSSNGAALAHRLASNADDSSLPIKGIVAKVTQLLDSPERSGPGTLNYNQPSSSRGSQKVSVLSIMGTEDGLIPYEGGSSSVFGGNDNFQLMSAMDSMNTWAIHNGCSGEYETSSHVSDKGDLTATKYTYGSCPSDIIVEHYAMNGAGHNAGGASIDGEKIDYVIAYDFIQRLENASNGPTSPVASPVISPVASPPTTVCVDDSLWVGKFNTDHTCEYVSQNPEQRCNWENSEGVKASDACLLSCGNCNVDTSAPVASPVSNENSCSDFPDKIKWKIQGVKSSLYCSDMTEFRCKKKKGKSLCPNTCGTTATWCSKDAKGQVEYGTKENGDTAFKGCSFVRRVPEKIAQRCSKGNIAMACRETCQNYPNRQSSTTSSDFNNVFT